VIARNREASKTSLRMPVLAVGGQRGIGPHVEASISQVADDVRGVLLEGAGHWLTDDCPAELATVLLDFFSADEHG
jgi:pimeloyl-ACP methyl ester carboxylesterase